MLELVEGPTLEDRIAQRPMPLDEALPIARQIADALEAAHERGIIHRDLKPANIKVTADGNVKVLDFGLAKAMDSHGVASSGQDLSLSPTLTTPGSVSGAILGTAAYMSPEQARGKPVDKRADIWAFGVVLYQMITGRPAFEGESVSTSSRLCFDEGTGVDSNASTGPALVALLPEERSQASTAGYRRRMGAARAGAGGEQCEEPGTVDCRRCDDDVAALATLVGGAPRMTLNYRYRHQSGWTWISVRMSPSVLPSGPLRLFPQTPLGLCLFRKVLMKSLGWLCGCSTGRR